MEYREKRVYDWADAVKLTAAEKDEAINLAVSSARAKGRGVIVWGDTLVHAFYEHDSREVTIYECKITKNIILDV